MKWFILQHTTKATHLWPLHLLAITIVSNSWDFWWIAVQNENKSTYSKQHLQNIIVRRFYFELYDTLIILLNQIKNYNDFFTN